MLIVCILHILSLCVCKIVHYVAGDIKKILRAQVASNMILKDIEQRLDKVENAIRSENLQNDNNQLAQLLPMISIKYIKDFESVLKDSHEGGTKFVSIFFYLLHII